MTKGTASLKTRCAKDSKKLRADFKKNAAKPAAQRRKDFVSEQGYNYVVDSADRTIKVSGTLVLKKSARSAHFQRKAGGKFRRKGDHGGHLIGARFHGSPKLRNTVAQHGGLNVGAWKKMENEWADALKAGKKVEVYMELVYPGASERPDSFVVYYTIDGIESSQTFDNLPGQTF